MNIAAALTAAREVLQRSSIADPQREVVSLVAFALDKPHSFQIAHPEYELNPDEQALFDQGLRRRAAREPFQYIVGRQEFFGLDFEVSPDVLIPRPETEILVENAIETLRATDDTTFCEIGVGSGCISVSLLHEVPNATGVAVDISPMALGVARRNAEKHRVADRLAFHEGDLFAKVTGRFNVIVSNPPYIPAADVLELQPEVRDFEPHNALDGGDDGLDFVRRIIRKAPEHLTTRGVLYIEIGFDQSGAVSELIDLSIWDAPVFLPDLQGVARVLRVQARF